MSGPGGAGKTRLAIEVARRLADAGAVPDGVWLVDLSGVRDRRLVPAAAAASLGLALTGARPTTAAVVEQLADRRMLVLLDNCEHLLAPPRRADRRDREHRHSLPLGRPAERGCSFRRPTLVPGCTDGSRPTPARSGCWPST